MKSSSPLNPWVTAFLLLNEHTKVWPLGAQIKVSCAELGKGTIHDNCGVSGQPALGDTMTIQWCSITSSAAIAHGPYSVWSWLGVAAGG